MTARPVLDWRGPAFDGDNRIVAFCGHVAIGAVFAPLGSRARRWRWRIWCSHNVAAVDGAARSENSAKAEVEERFGRFLEAARLTKVPT